MTITEAEEFFRRYDGHAFHMGREEPAMYREFIRMEISDSAKEQWRQEIIDGYIKRIKNGDVVPMTRFGTINTVSSLVRKTFDIIKNTKNNKCDNISLLLDAISETEIPDKREKIYIMERITENCDMIAGCGLGDKMNYVFEKLADFPITEEDKTVSTGYRNIPERYESAVSEYRQEYDYVTKHYAEKGSV